MDAIKKEIEKTKQEEAKKVLEELLNADNSLRENMKNSIKEAREKDEQEQVEQMSEELKEAFYKFKKSIKKDLEKDLRKEEKTEEEIEVMMYCLDFVSLFYLGIKMNETEQCLQVLIDKCMVMQNVHNMAYVLNSEYTILWDNLEEGVKKKVIRARKLGNLSNNYYKVLWGIATMGITAIGSMLLKKRQNKKIEEYVTGEEFTNLCIVVNKFHNYYKEDEEVDMYDD